ncbi:hypothetical protein [Robinsoniella peoriensis]
MAGMNFQTRTGRTCYHNISILQSWNCIYTP